MSKLREKIACGTQIVASLGPVSASERSLDQLYEALTQLARGRRLGVLEERMTELAGARLDPPGRLLLRRVADQGEVRLGELAALIGLDPSTVSRKVQQLEEAGLLARSADRADKRAAVVSVTAAGRRLLKRFDAARRQLLAEVLADWSVKDRQTLASLLQRLAADFARHGRTAAGARASTEAASRSRVQADSAARQGGVKR